MTRLLSAALCTLLLLSLSACGGFSPPGAAPSPSPAAQAGTAGGECANSYFPVVQGATWTYKVSGRLSGTLSRTITAVRPDGFTDERTALAGGTRSVDWDCSDGIIARQPDLAPSGLIPAGDLTADLHTTDTSGVTVPDNLGPDAKWNQESTMQGTVSINGQSTPARNEVTTDCTAASHDSVPVPAGTFNALRAECRTDEKLTVTLNGADVPTDIVTLAAIWYAPGVGMVKLEQGTSDATRTTFELASYYIP
jgi:hypothetical protein